MRVLPPSHNATLWLRWVLANTVGATLALSITLYMAQIRLRRNTGGGLGFGPIIDPGMIQDYTVVAVAIAMTVGLLQWLVVRRYVPNGVLWTLVTTLGALVGTVLGTVVASIVGFVLAMMSLIATGSGPGARLMGSIFILVPFIVAAALLGAIAGATVGSLQAAILRRQGLQASHWIRSNALGGATAGAVFLTGAVAVTQIYWLLEIASLKDLFMDLSFPVGAALGSVTGGAVTGVELTRILRPENTTSDQREDNQEDCGG